MLFLRNKFAKKAALWVFKGGCIRGSLALDGFQGL